MLLIRANNCFELGAKIANAADLFRCLFDAAASQRASGAVKAEKFLPILKSPAGEQFRLVSMDGLDLGIGLQVGRVDCVHWNRLDAIGNVLDNACTVSLDVDGTKQVLPSLAYTFADVRQSLCIGLTADGRRADLQHLRGVVDAHRVFGLVWPRGQFNLSLRRRNLAGLFDSRNRRKIGGARVAAAGGRDNAFTSRDYTAYFQQVPKEKLDEMMALEADRMRHLNVDPKEFAQEIKVVMEERRMRTDDNPQSKLFEQMNAVAFQAHPYRRPIIGWMNDLETMTAADAKAWYDTWYVPNNAYVVITGDVDHKAVFALAEKYYGPLEARPLPVRRQQIEPRQEGPRCVTVKAPAELPILIMGYKAPVIRDIERDSDPYALEMLASILDGHDAARFNKKLVREDKVALSVGIDYDDTARGPGMLYLHGTPSEGKTVADLEAALRAARGVLDSTDRFSHSASVAAIAAIDAALAPGG